MANIQQPATQRTPDRCITAVRRGLFAGIAMVALMAGLPAQPQSVQGILPSTFTAPSVSITPVIPLRALRLAQFGSVKPGAGTRDLADWISTTHDHQDQTFFIIDKRKATLYVFDRQARLQASSPVLLGAARGDDSVAGIGNRPIAQILPEERTTPAGRFIGEAGRNLQGDDIVWVDYDAAVSMHRVRTGNASERRAQRLATATVDDNRISYGCVNVPAAFYDRHVAPVFAEHPTALIYVMPETRPLDRVFKNYAPIPRQATRRMP